MIAILYGDIPYICATDGFHRALFSSDHVDTQASLYLLTNILFYDSYNTRNLCLLHFHSQ